jgi:exonuclease SbcC
LDQLAILNGQRQQWQETASGLERLKSELAILEQHLPALTEDEKNEAYRRGADHLKANIDRLKLKIGDLKLKLPELNSLTSSIQAELEHKRRNLVDIEAEKAQDAADFQFLVEFPDIVALRNLRSEISELNNELKRQQKHSRNVQTANKKNQTGLSSANSQMDTLRKQIDEHKGQLETITAGQSLDEIKQLQVEQKQRIKDIEQLISFFW